jgi:hypothetical protein
MSVEETTMTKLFASTLIAAVLASTAVSAQTVEPLEGTASTQTENLPVLTTIPANAIIVGGVVLLAGVAIGLSSDGTSGTGTGTSVP